MRPVALDQSLISKNTCFKRRDDLTTSDAATTALARTTTTMLSTPHVAGAPDQQSLAPVQVSHHHVIIACINNKQGDFVIGILSTSFGMHCSRG